MSSSSSGVLGSGLMKGFFNEGGTGGAMVGGGRRMVDMRREPGMRESAGSGVASADFRRARMACWLTENQFSVGNAARQMPSRSSLLRTPLPSVLDLPASHQALKVGELRCLLLSMVAPHGYAEGPGGRGLTGC